MTNPKPPFEAIRMVLDYNWLSEMSDFECTGSRAGAKHIFVALRTVRDWLAACGENEELTSETRMRELSDTFERAGATVVDGDTLTPFEEWCREHGINTISRAPRCS